MTPIGLAGSDRRLFDRPWPAAYNEGLSSIRHTQSRY